MRARVRPRRDARRVGSLVVARRRVSSVLVATRSLSRDYITLHSLDAPPRATRRLDAHIARLTFSRNDALRTPKTGQSPINAAFCAGDALKVVLSQPTSNFIATKTYAIVATGAEKTHPTSGRPLSTGTPRARVDPRVEGTPRARDGAHAVEPGRCRDEGTARAVTTRARGELEDARARVARVVGTRARETDARGMGTLTSGTNGWKGVGFTSRVEARVRFLSEEVRDAPQSDLATGVEDEIHQTRTRAHAGEAPSDAEEGRAEEKLVVDVFRRGRERARHGWTRDAENVL